MLSMLRNGAVLSMGMNRTMRYSLLKVTYAPPMVHRVAPARFYHL